MKIKYGKATIVFDGYGNNPSTKDHEHLRRSMKSVNCPDVEVQPHIKVATNQNAFLSSDANKTKLINLLSGKFQCDGCFVLRASDDADTMIVKAALDHCKNGDSVTVFANDTDVIIMLMYFWKEMGQVLIRSSYTKNGRSQIKQLDMETAIDSLDDSIIPYLLFIHAFGGCDTTSAIHDKGKASPLRLLQKSKKAQKLFDCFMDSSSLQNEIGDAGIKLFVMLYNGKPGDTLTELRYNTYMKMAASASRIVPSKLPPTERTAWYHSLRVYLQVWQWKSLMDCNLSPLEWGWKIINGKMAPIMTDQVTISQLLFSHLIVIQNRFL